MTTSAQDIPIANPSDVSTYDTCFCMWAGEMDPTQVYVWAKSFDDAFEELVEWLDDHAPGRLVSREHFNRLLEESSRELGIKLDRSGHSEDARVYDHAERDLTIIGHTTLKHGGHIASHEWGGYEVTGYALAAVRARSIEHVLQEDKEAIATELADIWDKYGEQAAEDNADDSGIDVRLQVLKDARWSVRSGLVDYDQDHTGYCGAGSVDADTDCEALAKELIEQALEQCAMSAE